MKKLIVIGVLCFSANSHALTQKIEVLGMVCAFCAQGIEKSFESVKNVKAVFVNLEDYFVAIESNDENGIDENFIRTVITESGYDVKKIEVVSESVSEIKRKYESK
ncbi:heavy metal-associated domain-containing protein [Methylophilaceae bacterium]|jgi:cation transport ATPase|nr:heavy-metal-associated domain-containing protein [Methylophilaceae bacterium]MDC1173556.1 heavy metal-associated domain-containing protein [Methylophilaceae bacterium]